jgi:hypothetical protein
LYIFPAGFNVLKVCHAQDSYQLYILSESVQIIASTQEGGKNIVLKGLINDYPKIWGADRILLYLNTLTSVDLLVKNRTHLFRYPREKHRPRQFDYELAFSWFCFPFGPPHEKDGKTKETRLKVVENMYTDAAKRNLFRNSLNKELLRLSNNELINKGLDIFDILDIDTLIQSKE